MNKNLITIREIGKATGLDRRTVRDYASEFGYDWQYQVTPSSSGHEAACLHKSAAQDLIDDIKKVQRAARLDTHNEVRELRKELKSSEEENARLSMELDAIRSAPNDDPAWLSVPEDNTVHHATMVLVLSDLHFGEVVSKKQVYGVNEYNVEIAERRVKNTGDHTILVARDYFQGGSRLKIDGAVVMLAGDIVSGCIHEELLDTNEQSVMQAVAHFVPHVAEEIIGKLYTEFGRVHVMSVPGNHDRAYRKVPSKNTATSAASWVFASWLKDRFSSVPEVTFDISEASDAYHTIYSTKFVLTHGDQFRGGDGQVGALGPVKRGALRKSMRDVHLGRPHDIMVLGHWHSYVSAPQQGFIMNGSLKGFDEYAARLNLVPEPAMQALFLTTPEYGVTFSAPIFADHHSDHYPK